MPPQLPSGKSLRGVSTLIDWPGHDLALSHRLGGFRNESIPQMERPELPLDDQRRDYYSRLQHTEYST